ncbi:hypothetical protein DMJ13_22915 [halophilic archaeon]|nr:hypothetical protein DMJ13_22915 [halophilic archaeon]
MAGISIRLSLSAGILIGLLGAVWIFKDASDHNIDSAVDWAVGFFVAFFLLPILGGIVVLVVYLRRRNQSGGKGKSPLPIR